MPVSALSNQTPAGSGPRCLTDTALNSSIVLWSGLAPSLQEPIASKPYFKPSRPPLLTSGKALR
jgi:hypothetical protein